MYLKLVLAGCCAALCGFAKADVVVLQNLSTTGQTTVTEDGTGNLGTNIKFFTWSPSSLSRLILFGTAGQTGITAKFNIGSGQSSAIAATEISSGSYAFDMTSVPGTSSMIAVHSWGLELRSFSTGASFYMTTDTTATTMNSSGFVGEGYYFNNLRFQFEGNSTTAVPEPSTLILTATALTAGAVGAWIKRRRQKSAETVESDKLS